MRLDGDDLNGRGGERLRGQIRYCRKTYRATEGQLVVDRLITTQLTRGIRGPAARARAHDALERASAAHCATMRPGELDIAETVLVGIARALVHRPRLLVIDEPTLGVDLFERDRILSLLRSLADDGIAVLMSVGETTCLAGADRALSLADGELHGELAPPELAPVILLHDVAGGRERVSARRSLRRLATTVLELDGVVKRYTGCRRGGSRRGRRDARA